MSLQDDLAAAEAHADAIRRAYAALTESRAKEAI